MKCKQYRHRISNIVWESNNLPDDHLLIHLSQCKECSAFYNNYIKGINALRFSINNAVQNTSINQELLNVISNDKSVPVSRKLIIEHKPAINQPVLKLTWSVAVAAAAVFTGVFFGMQFSNSSNENTIEGYQQEITMNSNDISGLNNNLIDYFESESYEKVIDK